MNNETKIQELWKYMKIQDDTRLIVQSFNHLKGHDEYFVASKNGDKLVITIMDSIPMLTPDKPFQLIQQVGANGRHIIPSVRQIIQTKEMDY